MPNNFTDSLMHTKMLIFSLKPIHFHLAKFWFVSLNFWS